WNKNHEQNINISHRMQEKKDKKGKNYEQPGANAPAGEMPVAERGDHATVSGQGGRSLGAWRGLADGLDGLHSWPGCRGRKGPLSRQLSYNLFLYSSCVPVCGRTNGGFEMSAALIKAAINKALAWTAKRGKGVSKHVSHHTHSAVN